jgi:hypothetical protein
MNMYDYIDDYKAGVLSGEELAAFETALTSDEKLRHLVNHYDHLKSVSEGILEMQLLQEVSAAGVKQLKQQNKKNNSHPLFYLAAACIIAAFVLYHWQFGKNDEPILFADVYQAPIWPIERASTTSSLDSFISQAAKEYVNNDNLPRAKEILLDSVSDKNLGRYWLAEMYMQDSIPDSVLVFVPDLDAAHVKYNKSLHLKVLAYHLVGDHKKAKKAANLLPANGYEDLRRFIEQE